MGGSVNKRMYGFLLWLVKVIPMILAAMTLVHTIISYYDVDLILVNQFGGVSFFSLLFLYLSSFAFGFDTSHRIFIYYVIVSWILQLIDYYIGIPLNNKDLLIMYLVIAGLSVLIYVCVRPKRHGDNEIRIPNSAECASPNNQKTERRDYVNKSVYRYELLAIKLIPIIIVGLMVLNTTLSYFGIDWEIFSHLAGVSFLSILLMYISSIVFRFCAYHRIFIHYITLLWLLSIIDWYTDVLRNNISIDVLLLLLIAFGITIFLAIILKIKRI